MDVISMRDFSKEDILMVLDAAEEVRSALHEGMDERFREKYGRSVHEILEGALVADLFCENSTRTRHSSRVSAGAAGAFIDGFPTDEHTSLLKGETWEDTVAMFSGLGYKAVIMRSSIEGLPRWTAEAVSLGHRFLEEQHEGLELGFGYKRPMVINGGDGSNQHPTQCFLDLFTMRTVARKKGKDLDGLTVAMMNDLKYGRTNSSLMSVAGMFDWKLHFAHPPRFGPQKRRLRELDEAGVSIHFFGTDMLAAMYGADFAYHSRPQKERVGVGEDLRTIKEEGQIRREMYDKMGGRAPFLMHPLPVDSKNFVEIHPNMRFHPLNITRMQAMGGRYVRTALLALGLGKMGSTVEPWKPGGTSSVSLQDLDLSIGNGGLENPKSGYIRDSGVVLDHIPSGYGRRLEGVLGLEGSSLPIVTARNIPVDAGKRPAKDILKIHAEYLFSDQQYEAMALLAPEISVSFIRGGEVVKKVRPEIEGLISDRVQCGNENCVTTVEHEPVRPKTFVENLGCVYCETPDTIENVYNDNRFVYIGQERDL